ncbi:MAG: DedA family protein [Desulfobacterota bacterium]|jgi:membrane protein DedA with SNARE-associated domain|nr:DedA family protein [Thermodesulfobacteriota bacterium]
MTIEKFLSELRDLPDVLIYLLLGLSAFVENLVPPIPGDTITAFGAFLVGVGKLSFAWVYISTTIGSLLGFMCLFWLGGFLGRHFFIERDFRFLRAKDIIKAEEWFGRYGYFLILFNRFMPGIRSAVALAAGISRFRTVPVLFLSLLSCAAWNLIWIFMGHTLGTHWETVEKKMGDFLVRYNVAMIVLIVLVVLFFTFKKRFRKKPE